MPTPTPAPVRITPSPVPRRTSDDLAFRLVGGTWSCETLAGSTGTHVYEQIDDVTLSMKNDLRVAGRNYTILETYHFDPASELWTVRTERDEFVGTAGAWSGEKWVFTGDETTGGHRRHVRMIYTDLGEVAFRRDFQEIQNGHFATYSGETCKRLNP